ncbi:MAG: hypothetical protein NTW96_02050 [Planctomycetia bacterium]|nr:hypothetical protein [Planctomycetia bacterium]
MLTREQFQQIELEGHTAEILADSSHILQARYFWNKNHPGSTPLDITSAWNRRRLALDLLAKLATGEELISADIETVQHIITSIRREENCPDDGDVVE